MKKFDIAKSDAQLCQDPQGKKLLEKIKFELKKDQDKLAKNLSKMYR